MNTIFDFITDIDAKEAELTAITFMLATADPYTQLMYSSYLQYLNESISDLKTVLAGTYSQFLQDYQTALNQHGTLVLLLPPDLADQLPPPPFYTIPEGYLPPTGPGV